MYLLAIETTGAFASVALMKDDKIIGQVHGNDRFSHLQNLMPQVEAVVKENKLSLGDMTAIAVSCGPGSFTGIRIGVSSARALSQVLGIPCVPVSSLAALAMRAAAAYSCKGADGENALCKDADDGVPAAAADDRDVLICPMLDARRSQVYAGGYFLKNGYPVEEIKAGPYMLDEFLAKTVGYDHILVLGDAIDKYEEKITQLRPNGVELAAESIRYQDAAFVAKLAKAHFEAHGGLPFQEVKPEYMRLAEAERKLKEQQAAIKNQKG